MLQKLYGWKKRSLAGLANREVEGWHENVLFSTVRERHLELLSKSLCLRAEHHESEGGSWAPEPCVVVLTALVEDQLYWLKAPPAPA